MLISNIVESVILDYTWLEINIVYSLENDIVLISFLLMLKLNMDLLWQYFIPSLKNKMNNLLKNNMLIMFKLKMS